MRYLFYHEWASAPKNKLETEFFAYLINLDRFNFEAIDLNKTLLAIGCTAKTMQTTHFRCKPLVIEFRVENNGDIILNIGGGINSPVKARFLKFEN